MADAPLNIPTQAFAALAKGAEQTHARFQVAFEQQHLTVDLMLPKLWVQAKGAKDSLFPAPVFTTFTDADKQQPALVALAISDAPFEVPIDVWTRLTLENEGWTIARGAWHSGPYGLFYESTATRLVGMQQVVRRMSARLHKATIITASTACPRERWDALKNDLWLAHLSLELVGISADGASETRKRTAAARGSAKTPRFEIAYPASWTGEAAASKDPEASGVHLRLLDAHETLLGYLVVRARRHSGEKPALQALIDSTKRMSEGAGAQWTSAPRALTPEDDPRAEAVPGWLGGFLASGKLGNAECDVRFGFVQKQDVTFTLLALSPPRRDDLQVALRTQRTFEIARAELQTNEP